MGDHLVRRLLIVWGLVVPGLLGCALLSPTQTPTETAAPTPTGTPTRAARPDTPVPAATPTRTSVPTHTPTPVPEPSPTPTPATPFHLITVEDGLPVEEVRDLWTAPDGRLWLVGESGIFVSSGEEWLPLYGEAAGRILGADSLGRIWAILDEGRRIGAYEEGSWALYGAEEGWGEGFGGALASDRQGRVWVTAGEELRRFDPQTQRWETFTADDIGFEPLAGPVEPGRFLTDVVLDQAGNIWVGNCVYEGIGIDGQGVRWFDGVGWHGSADTAGECVGDIEVDEVGRVWMTGFDGLILYDPAAGTWSRLHLPPWERRQIVTHVLLDGAGNPWVTFTRYGGAGPWHSSAVYHLEGGLWTAHYDPGDDYVMVLAPAPGDVFWLCSEGSVYRMAADGDEEIGPLRGICLHMAVDGSGRVWIGGEDGSGSALWWFEPEG